MYSFFHPPGLRSSLPCLLLLRSICKRFCLLGQAYLRVIVTPDRRYERDPPIFLPSNRQTFFTLKVLFECAYYFLTTRGHLLPPTPLHRGHQGTIVPDCSSLSFTRTWLASLVSLLLSKERYAEDGRFLIAYLSFPYRRLVASPTRLAFSRTLRAVQVRFRAPSNRLGFTLTQNLSFETPMRSRRTTSFPQFTTFLPCFSCSSRLRERCSFFGVERQGPDASPS